MSFVIDLTTSTGSPRKMPLNRYSSMIGGHGAVAEKIVTGSAPSATDTGKRSCPASNHSRIFDAPSWCSWMCMPVVFASKTCIRYMPMLCLPLRFCVTTSGSVMNGPPSSGHVVSTGSA